MIDNINIGEAIKKKMEEDGRKVSWLAEKINCNRNNIYRIYEKKHLDTELLLQICVHLEIDLFSLYSQQINEEIHKKGGKT